MTIAGIVLAAGASRRLGQPKQLLALDGVPLVCRVPAVLGRERFPDLLELRGDRGARAILRSDPCVVAIDWPDGAFDVDTPADAAELAQNS